VTSISRNEIADILKSRGQEQEEFFQRARDAYREVDPGSVYLRGLLEISNICVNDCLYCGIRKSNSSMERYDTSVVEIIEVAANVWNCGIRSMVIQSGERRDKNFTEFIEDMLKGIKAVYPEMAITLSLGEQSPEVYRRFFEAGAGRYLLRIETSSKKLYEKIHPEEMSYENRVRCLESLREAGYQVGTGVMIGLPGQRAEDLADDILFFRNMDIDMCGMGPFIPHGHTPMGGALIDEQERLALSLNMISALRIAMPFINIAATTALETISPGGRKLGVLAGANVIMPQFSPEKNRGNYKLYEGKPERCPLSSDIVEEMRSIGMEVRLESTGTSAHYKRRKSCQ